jgi:hypothetical protein
MNTKSGIRKSDAAQPTKYAWVAALTLMAILIAGAVAPVLAGPVEDGALPFRLQSGLTTAHLDKGGRFIGKADVVVARIAEKDLSFGLQSGLFTARRVGYHEPMNLVGGAGTPFGLQSGLVTARAVGYREPLSLVAGESVSFGIQSGLVTAHLQGDGTELSR